MSGQVADAATHEEPHHAVPLSLYFWIYGILMALLVLTVWVNDFNFGMWNLPIALTIAAIKAILVIIYFMHMRFTGKLMWIYTAVAFVWLGMLLFGVMTDVTMRGH